MKESKEKTVIPKQKPGRTIEARENQLIALAMDRAEERLRAGTASPSEIVHFLKLGSTREQLDKETKSEELNLLKAKTESIKKSTEMDIKVEEAIRAFRCYSGQEESEDDEE
jgi:hypothetical protein